ncbi:MAG: hypothetical protein EXR71_20755 [Myxococcales bacterium]|nr:hypothetical protein [Myxococcales bacterium]
MILLNEVVRGALRAGVPFAAWSARRAFAARITRFSENQAALRLAYGVAADTAIVGYDAATRARIEALAAAHPDVALAYTSGTTGVPKALAYPPSRLRSFKADSQAVGVQAWHRIGVRGAAFFILGGLSADRSFATLVLHRGEPSRLTSLLEPARHLSTPAMAAALADHGPTAARLWLMLLSNPGMIYSTNPSTLAVFLAELQSDWATASSLARAWVRGTRDAGLTRVVARIGSAGAGERLRRVAESSEMPPLHEVLPGLGAYCCWDGGYVTGFLRQIQGSLPANRFKHIPMYAMSTETIETLPWFEDDGSMRFLPLGPGVLYELLPEGAPDDPALLLPPAQAVAGEAYTLVVSDPYGLVRYQTEDVFRCRGHVRGLPDLHFERRRGLAWSFTGEKLTGEQVAAVFADLDRTHPRLSALAAQLTVMPSWPDGDALPRYRLVVAHPSARLDAPPDLDALAHDLDAGLAALNDEYATKRSSGRLGAPVAHLVPYDRVAEALDARRVGPDQGASRGWESQFKLMPLTRVRWEELALA